MKLKNAIIHAAVVSALAAGVAGSAQAVGQWSLAYTGTVLATEVFGDTGNSLSNETLITAPARTYNVLTAVGADEILSSGTAALPAGPVLATTYVDIKFTLSGGAVFGEAMNDNTTGQILKFLSLTADLPALAAAGAPVAIPAASIDSDLTGAADDKWHAVVMSGGAIGDNTVAIRIFNSDSTAGPETLTLQSVTFGGYKVKNLKPALDKDSSHSVVLGVNYTPTTGAGNAETTTPAALFTSQDAVRLALTTGEAPVAWYINAADDRKKFAAVAGAAGATNFNPGLATIGTAGAQLATLQLMSGTTANGPVNALREDLTNFVFMGGDNIVVTLDSSANGTFNAFKAPGAISLTQGTCATPVAPTVAGTISTDGKTAAFNVSALTDAQLNQSYKVCVTANGTTAIDEQDISAAAAVDFLNARYWDRNVTAAGPVVTRVNGESQAVPYVLSSGNAYQTYLRVANNSSKGGRVTVQCRKNGSDATANQGVTTGTLSTMLGANNAKFFTAADVAAACGANGSTAGSDFSYVIVRGEFQYMDAGQYMFNPNGGVVTQLNTNVTTGRTATNGNSLNAY